MKGIVFTMLNDMVEEQLGLDAWEELLNEANPESGGIYTAAESYPDEELLGLVSTLSNTHNIPIPDLVKAFGEFSLGFFAENYGVFFEGHDAKSFLMSVEDVIHVEVRKLYPKAGLPTFSYEDPAPNKLIMHYRSPRKLFDFAEGLIAGTSKHFDVGIDVNRYQPDGADEFSCAFELTFAQQ